MNKTRFAFLYIYISHYTIVSYLPVLASRLVKIKSILSSAELFTFLAVTALAGQMLGFYVVPHICSLCISVLTVTALPQTFIVPQHLAFYYSHIFTSDQDLVKSDNVE